MQLWLLWVAALESLLRMLAPHLGAGAAIIVATLLLRTLVLPLTWSLAYRAQVRQRLMLRLQPELKAIRERYATDQAEQARQTLELYRRHGLTLFDGRGMLGAAVQLPIFLGMYTALRRSVAGAFLWVVDLGRPDAVLAMLAGLTTVLLMAAGAEVPESLRLVMFLLPLILTLMAALHVASGIALYWVTSNAFGAAQGVILRAVLMRRVRTGRVR
jgi:YidC/Oxa1 family membrane protein insertase